MFKAEYAATAGSESSRAASVTTCTSGRQDRRRSMPFLGYRVLKSISKRTNGDTGLKSRGGNGNEIRKGLQRAVENHWIDQQSESEEESLQVLDLWIHCGRFQDSRELVVRDQKEP